MKFDKRFVKFIGRSSNSCDTAIIDFPKKRFELWTDPDSLNW